ncbi:MAG: hypothetical protein ABI920_16440 [Casimicrobiaceae bacterium]
MGRCNFRTGVAAAAFAALTALTFVAGAKDVQPKTSASTDWSDIWWNPAESGWGMQLVQESGTVFATLFVYGADGRPTWFIAVLTLSGGNVLSGPLFATTGPYFGGDFNPAFTTVRQVGTMTFVASSIATASLTYVVDGVTVAKSIERQTLSVDNYNGAYVVLLNSTSSACNDPAFNGSSTDALTMSVAQTPSTMSMVWDFGGGSVCAYSGVYAQTGKFGRFSGTYSCNNGDAGTMSFIEMTNRVGMLSGRLSGASSATGCALTGRFTGLNPSVP